MKRLHQLFCVIIFILLLIGLAKPNFSARAGSCVAKDSGPWLNKNTWSGCDALTPGSNDDVTIPVGITVELNTDSSIKSLTILGTLKPPAKSLTFTLTLLGNFVNDGTFTSTLVSGNKTSYINVILNGMAAQTISGTSQTTFHDLTINNNNYGATLNQNATVSNQLSLTAGDITTASVLTLGGSSQGTYDVWGTTRRNHTFTNGQAYSFGSSDVSLTFSASGTLPSQVDVKLTKGPPPDYNTAVGRYYEITPTNGSGYSATLRLRYIDDELPVNYDESTFYLLRYQTVWVPHSFMDTTPVPASNYVECTNVTAFSRWAISNLTPTAIPLVSLNAEVKRNTWLTWGMPIGVAWFALHLIRLQKRYTLFHK